MWVPGLVTNPFSQWAIPLASEPYLIQPRPISKSTQNSKCILPLWPAVLCQVAYSKRPKSETPHLSTWLTPEPSTVAYGWQQPRCPGSWRTDTHRMWSIATTEGNSDSGYNVHRPQGNQEVNHRKTLDYSAYYKRCSLPPSVFPMCASLNGRPFVVKGIQVVVSPARTSKDILRKRGRRQVYTDMLLVCCQERLYAASRLSARRGRH